MEECRGLFSNNSSLVQINENIKRCLIHLSHIYNISGIRSRDRARIPLHTATLTLIRDTLLFEVSQIERGFIRAALLSVRDRARIQLDLLLDLTFTAILLYALISGLNIIIHTKQHKIKSQDISVCLVQQLAVWHPNTHTAVPGSSATTTLHHLLLPPE